MIWKNGRWKKFKINESKNSDLNTYRINTYRLLLTCGRDGFIIFVSPISILDEVYKILKKSGIKELN